jgi:hypothetical protein
VEVTESVANEALFGSEDLLQSLRDRELRDWMWDADQDSAPNAEGSDVTEEMDADGAPEPVNVTSTNAATREVAGGTPGLEGAAGAPEARYGKGQVALVSESVFSLHATSVAEGIREVEAFLDENGENGVVLDDGRWDTLAYGVASLREQMPQMEPCIVCIKLKKTLIPTIMQTRVGLESVTLGRSYTFPSRECKVF